MNEIELKYRIDGIKDRVLLILDTKTIGKREIYKDVYFTHPCLVPKGSQRELRVRQIQSENKNRNILTFKKDIINDESGSKNEFEVSLNNGDDAIKLLLAMGFKIDIEFSKDCINYLFENYSNYGEMLVTYVTVPEISGCFLELEITTNASDNIDVILNKIKEFAYELGLDDEMIEKGLYTDSVRKARN